MFSITAGHNNHYHQTPVLVLCTQTYMYTLVLVLRTQAYMYTLVLVLRTQTYTLVLVLGTQTYKDLQTPVLAGLRYSRLQGSGYHQTPVLLGTQTYKHLGTSCQCLREKSPPERSQSHRQLQGVGAGQGGACALCMGSTCKVQAT